MKKSRKNHIVRLYGNDDRRAVYAHVDELHPRSRLRATIHYDRVTKLYCNVGRDVLRSLVASQRHNQLLIKGDATAEELLLELQRDCVDIVRYGDVNDVHLPIGLLCTRIASAIVSWPRLLQGMRDLSMPRDYSVGPTHAIVRIGSKPNIERIRQYKCRELVHAFCACHEGSSFDDIKSTFSRVKLHTWLQEQPVFWFNDYDTCARSTSALHAAVVQDLDFLEMLNDEMRRHAHQWPEMDAIFARFSETRHAPAVDMLFDAIAKLGWSVERLSPAAGMRKLPLVFPTAWVDRRECVGSIDMLLRPPL